MTEIPRLPLTPPQRRFYVAILAWWRDHGRAPSTRELAGSVGVRPNAAHQAIGYLRYRKYISEGSITPVELERASKLDAGMMLNELTECVVDSHESKRRDWEMDR